MTARPHPSEFAIDDFLRRQERKSLLRFVACGSVDHGKSTLIGRLLYESKLVFDDQLDELKSDSRKYGTQGKELDFALLLDGLAANASRRSPSTSPTASSPRSGGNSSSPMRPAMSSTRA